MFPLCVFMKHIAFMFLRTNVRTMNVTFDRAIFEAILWVKGQALRRQRQLGMHAEDYSENSSLRCA